MYQKFVHRKFAMHMSWKRRRTPKLKWNESIFMGHLNFMIIAIEAAFLFLDICMFKLQICEN